jgi:hypothetical protein
MRTAWQNRPDAAGSRERTSDGATVQASGMLVGRWRRGALFLAIAGVLAVTSLVACLDEPTIDKRWTLLEFVDVSPQPGQATPADQPVNVTVKGRITYRRIVTGYLVAEVRYSDTISPTSVVLDPTRHTLALAQDVDRIIANSVTAGRATKIVTGFDHLMQDVNLSFTAQVPQAMFAGGGTPTGGLFLVLYMGDGDELRLPGGRDSLVVTPFVSEDREVLHTGFALAVTPPGGAP